MNCRSTLLLVCILLHLLHDGSGQIGKGIEQEVTFVVIFVQLGPQRLVNLLLLIIWNQVIIVGAELNDTKYNKTNNKSLR